MRKNHGLPGARAGFLPAHTARVSKIGSPYRRAGERAQNLAEFAIALPVLLLLLLVILDLGRITYTYTALHNAVREGARYGVVHYDNLPGVESYARTYAIGLRQDALTLTPVYNAAAETITVTGLYDFTTASPILRLILDTDTYTLHAAARMQTEE